MNDIWQRIESWLSQHAPAVLQSLRRGATEDEVASAQSILRRSLPSDYRESLLIHDGQILNEFGNSPPFIYGLNLFSLTTVISRRQMVDELLNKGLGKDLSISVHGPVRPVWWDRLWVPIAEDGSNNYCCLDLNPAAGGHVGQVIQVWNESHLRTVLSKSFREWLVVFVELIEVGEFIYSEPHKGLISLEDAVADGVVKP